MVYYNVKMAFDEPTDKGMKVRREEFLVSGHSVTDAEARAIEEFGNSLETFEVTSVTKTKIKGVFSEEEKEDFTEDGDSDERPKASTKLLSAILDSSSSGSNEVDASAY